MAPLDIEMYLPIVWTGSQMARGTGRYLALVDGVPEPAPKAGIAWIYVDDATGDLMVKFSNGVAKTLATNP